MAMQHQQPDRGDAAPVPKKNLPLDKEPNKDDVRNVPESGDPKLTNRTGGKVLGKKGNTPEVPNNPGDRDTGKDIGQDW